MRILVTGATGYIGGRLVPRLLEAGHEVRCLARSPQRLSLYPWRHQVEVAQGDVLDEPSLKEALLGCDTAVYLVHSMAAGGDFEALDRTAAENFRAASDDVGIGRIVYLGGLGDDDAEHSPHLRSRHEVGRILAAGATSVTEVRAANPTNPSKFSTAWSDYVAAVAASPTSEALTEFTAEATEAVLSSDTENMSRLEILSRLRVPVCALSSTGYRKEELERMSAAASISC